jgi:hypothetical protein
MGIKIPAVSLVKGDDTKGSNPSVLIKNG